MGSGVLAVGCSDLKQPLHDGALSADMLAQEPFSLPVLPVKQGLENVAVACRHFRDERSRGAGVTEEGGVIGAYCLKNPAMKSLPERWIQ